MSLKECHRKRDEYEQHLNATLRNIKYPRTARYDSVKRQTDRYFLKILYDQLLWVESENTRLKKEIKNNKRKLEQPD